MRKLTLAFVQSQLKALEGEVDQLQSERRELMHRVRRIDKRIADIKGGTDIATDSTTTVPIVRPRKGGIYDKLVEGLSGITGELTPDDAVKAFKKAGGHSTKGAIMQVFRTIPGLTRIRRGVYTYSKYSETTTTNDTKSTVRHTKLVEALQSFNGKDFTPINLADAFHKLGGKTQSANPSGSLMQDARRIDGVTKKDRGVYHYQQP